MSVIHIGCVHINVKKYGRNIWSSLVMTHLNLHTKPILPISHFNLPILPTRVTKVCRLEDDLELCRHVADKVCRLEHDLQLWPLKVIPGPVKTMVVVT